MNPEDTIAAVSTPSGHGGIGIVRLTGADAISIADTIFQSARNKLLSGSSSHRILYGHIKDPSSGEIIDEVLVSVMRAPHTYTREDIIEINCHGGYLSVKKILELTLREGARLAGPGEFTQRAYINGRLDLAQAEAVNDLIHAMTGQGEKAAMEQLRGSLSVKVEEIRSGLAELAAFVEAYIDFPEEDIASLDFQDMRTRAADLGESMVSLIEGSRYGTILRDGLRTAIVGRPNVGKSSLLNALLQHDRAIVTDMPGTTRDVIEECLNINGLPLRIMDTAGIRHVDDIAEQEGVKRSISAMEGADLVLLMFDGSDEMHATDQDLIEKSDPDKTIYIINKTDREERFAIQQKLSPLVRISVKGDSGLDELKKAVSDHVLRGNTHESSCLVTNTRHVSALKNATRSLEAFTSALQSNTFPEFLAVDLRDALDSLGDILGITTTDDVLNIIFEKFCVGK
ncbi:MAG: tRNA uridine-5-carboxymethylaminomethyl(34) synthesis GTPase MnmE [Nitrospira sp.]|nr:tRNA uridine-5-carboxymethylaminomethyl(34) synthesis GTPase MnmE [Nitrospira sp.]